MEKDTVKKSRGRPRTFDRQAALQCALELFWSRGYEGTSIADLVTAMGINPPSLYAAFGSKEALFLEVIECYLQGPGSFLQHALENADSTYAFVAHMLTDAATEFTDYRHPAGCLIANTLLACPTPLGDLATTIQEMRLDTLNVIEQRLRLGQQAGELPQEADCEALARFYSTVLQGMSIQARDGASKEALLSVVAITLSRWPQSLGA